MTELSFDIYVRATPEQVWQALIDPAQVPRYRFGFTMYSDWQPGSSLTSTSPEGEGTVVEAVPGQRLVYEWIQTDAPENNGGRPSTVTFALTPMGEVTRLSVGHASLDPDAPFLKVVSGGWPMILSSLKSLLETGQPLAYAMGT